MTQKGTRKPSMGARFKTRMQVSTGKLAASARKKDTSKKLVEVQR